jgi:hypothetical protein
VHNVVIVHTDIIGLVSALIALSVPLSEDWWEFPCLQQNQLMIIYTEGTTNQLLAVHGAQCCFSATLQQSGEGTYSEDDRVGKAGAVDRFVHTKKMRVLSL